MKISAFFTLMSITRMLSKLTTVIRRGFDNTERTLSVPTSCIAEH